MNRERMTYHLENWRDAQNVDPVKQRLGFPASSVGFQTGTDSVEDVFDILCDEVDSAAARAMDAIIDSLRKPQKDAIRHQWLREKLVWPTHEMDLEMAYESIMLLADKRGLV
jgi:hypothetical protein